MEKLIDCSCEACSIDAPLATEKQIEQFMPQIPDWKMVTVAGVNRLVRSYRFTDFVQAMAFTNQVGVLAESANHHPALLTEWGNVEVSWWSHKIKGLHSNDFIMAAKTDGLASSLPEK